MKRTKALLFGIAAAGLSIPGLHAARAQDPAVVNAKSITVKLDNDKVRVLEASIAPGMKEQMHSHPGYVIYVIEGGKMRNHSPDGKTTESELKAGDVIYRDAVTHWAENVGNTTVHLILVEMKK
ncbi:MAG TPA: cupin domain-containing protein [Thermoanaerobaculia bacterium]|jgi:quercetin dioxygenase-like cupin family protein